MTAGSIPRAPRSFPGLRKAPLTVFVGCEGKHLFEQIHDERVRVVTRPDGLRPDIVVFPCGRDRRFDNVLAQRLPDSVHAALIEGTTGVVFDASLEGVPHKPDITASLHTVLRHLGVSPLKCVYVTQERNYGADYRAHCEAAGIDCPVSVLNHDYWIWHALAEFEDEGEDVYRGRLRAFRSRPRCRARRFISLNRTPRPTKILFLLSLLRDGLWDKGFISFGGFAEAGRPGKPRPSAEQLTAALPGFENKVVELAPMLDALNAYGRVLFGLDRHGWTRLELSNAGLAADLAEYDNCWFSVVTETEMRRRPSRITEKVIKPLVNFQPLIVLGNPGALKMIQGFGFATFDEVVDESYDEELDPGTRFDLVYREVVRLCGLDDDELNTLENTIEDKLIFNARWGLTRFPGVYRSQRDVAMVNDILACMSRTGDV